VLAVLDGTDAEPYERYVLACFVRTSPDYGTSGDFDQRSAQRLGLVQQYAKQISGLHPPCPNAKRIQIRISSAVVSTVKTVV
jgi:hypothetical protein